MRAVVVAGPGRLAVETVPDPTPEPGQAVVRVAACGICGSDLHVHQGGWLPAGSIMGHEFCGEVVEPAGGLVTGERVCVLPALSCGRCERCRSGLGMYCAEQRPLGLGQAPGAFAQYVAIAPHHAVRLPPGIDDEHGALVEPLAVALHAVNVARLGAGERCVGVGAGPIGLALVLWARLAGAREVIVSERSPGRRALAERIGATHSVDPAGGGLEQAVGPGGADVVFEAVGAPGLVQECIGHARFRGRVVVVGVCIGPDQFQPMTAVLKELELRFTMAYERTDFERTIEGIERGELRPGALVTARIGLDGVPAAFEALARPDADCKVIVRP